MSMDKSDDGMVVEIRAVKTSNKQQYAPVPDYLDEYDQYGLDNEKYFLGGQGGKQRTKKDIAQNVKYDPCGNVRKITSNLMNFEHNRRK